MLALSKTHWYVYLAFTPPQGNNLIRISQKLIVIGGMVETARRALISAWSGLLDCLYLRSSFEVKHLTEAQRLAFYLTAHFGQEDCPYDW